MRAIGFLVLYTTLLLTCVNTALAESDIWAAAREGDQARVEALLNSGVDVNVKSRYNVTPLYFAADNGHAGLVRFLLKKGATNESRDDFFMQTALSAAMRGGHTEVAVQLIKSGAVDAMYTALFGSIRSEMPEVTDALLQRGSIYDFEKAAALALARQTENSALAEKIERIKAKSELPFVKLAPESLQRAVGFYRNREGETSEVEIHKGALRWRMQGDEAWTTLSPLAHFHFRSPDNHNVGAYFTGRLGIVEWLSVVDGTENTGFRKFEPDTMEQVTAAPTADFDEATDPGLAAPRKAAKPWPSFRGANASGLGDGQGVPSVWNVETGKNVLWKIPVAGLAHSSPVVWGNRVFLTTAISEAGDPISDQVGKFIEEKGDDTVKHTWKTFAFDKATGQVVWEHAAGTAVPLIGRHATSSHANSTATTDGRFVVVLFPTVGMVCFDMDGNVKWKKDLGGLNASNYVDASMHWGFASSPILDQGKVIVQADIHEGAYLAAFDLETGREVWKTPRDEVSSWATPTIYRDDEHQEIITNGPTIRGYDPKTGQELWTLGPNSQQVVPTPITAHGLIYVTTGYPPAYPIYAVRPGQRGDLSLSGNETSSDRIAWSHPRGGSYMVTPIVYNDLLYVPADGGRLTAYDAVNGKRIYRARLSKQGNFTGSPVAADERLFLPTEIGLIYVIKTGPEYQELAINDMQEGLTASPAISDGALFVRTRSHLYALGIQQ